MKKASRILLSSIFAGALLCSPGLAVEAFSQNGGYQGPSSGGFSGPGPKVMTIKEASKQADDTWVTLRGKIINNVGGDIYTFQDASGTGKVEIDNEVWAGQNITANDTVEILVEVEKDWGHIEFEAERIRIVK